MGRKALARIRVRFVAIAAGVLLGVLSLGCASSTPPDAETIAASAGTAGEGAVAASPAIVEERLTMETGKILPMPEVSEAAPAVPPAPGEEGAQPAPAADTAAAAPAEGAATSAGVTGAPPSGLPTDFSPITEADYRISPGDILDFQSFDDESINRPGITVRFDGHVSLPLIPDVKVQGLTRTEAISALVEAYRAVFKDPQLSLTIRETPSKRYFVMGEVNRPNEYPYRRQTTVLEAINLAGGLRTAVQERDSYVGAQGQLTKAYVIRHQDGDRHVIELDLRQLIVPGPHLGDTPVFPDDVIYVPEGINLVYLIGEVRRSDVYQIQEGMTILRLLARSGGPIESTARLKHVVLMRQVDEQNTDLQLLNVREMLATGKDVVLKPGDIIYVPRKRTVKLQEVVTRFTGTVSPIMNLYQNAYDTYFTDQRYDRLFNTKGTTNNTLATIEALRTLGNLVGSIPVTGN